MPLKIEKPAHALAHHLEETHLLLADDALERVHGYLATIAARMDAAAESFASSDPDFWHSESSFIRSIRPYEVKDGVLQIPVKGMLLNEFPYAWGRYATGYEYLEAAFERGAEDFKAGRIRGVAMMVDSPGGKVAGCFEACEKVGKLISDTGMPVVAFASYACSAAYAWSVLGEGIKVGRLSEVGSIGVLMQHMSYAGMLEKEGIEVTLITSPKGGFKGDGNPAFPLSESAQKRMQSISDAIYGIFVGHVASNRGMSEEDVRGTKAGVFLADAAIEKGLADEQVVLSDALISYRQSLNGEKAMTGKNEGGAAVAASITKEQHDAAVAQATEAGRKEGAEAERKRISSVVSSDAAKGKTASALALALSSGDITAESAATVLATISVQPEGKASKTGFENAMETTQNPNAGPGDGGDSEDNSPEAHARRMLGNYAATTGYDYRPKQTRGN